MGRIEADVDKATAEGSGFLELVAPDAHRALAPGLQWGQRKDVVI